MMPEDVGRAVERLTELTPCDYETYKTIRAHLLAREAEVDAVSTELRTMRGEFAKQFKRAERAEALLREWLPPAAHFVAYERGSLHDRTHAHLSENSRG